MTQTSTLPASGRIVLGKPTQTTETTREEEKPHEQAASFEDEYYAALEALKQEGHERHRLVETNEFLESQLQKARNDELERALRDLKTLEAQAEEAYIVADRAQDPVQKLKAEKLLMDITARKEVFEYDKFKREFSSSQEISNHDIENTDNDYGYDMVEANRAYAAFEQRNSWMKNSKMKKWAEEEANLLNEQLTAKGHAHLIHTPDYYAYIEQKVHERQGGNEREVASDDGPSLAEEYNQDLKKRGYQTGATFSRQEIERVSQNNLSTKIGRNSWTDSPVELLTVYTANKHRIEKLPNGIKIHGRKVT